MSRRKVAGEQEFGSDSFLDIIANIVGILIILIVVAGVKVARQPTVMAENTSVAVAGVNNLSLGSKDSSRREFDLMPPLLPPGFEEPSEDLPDFEPIQEADVPVAPDPFVAAALADAETADARQQADTVEREIADLSLQLQQAQETTATSEAELQEVLDRQQQALADARLSKLRAAGIQEENEQASQTIEDLQESVEDVDNATDAFRSTLDSLTQRQKEINDALSEVGKETLRLKEVLDKARPESASADRIQHRLSPVGAASSDQELHFRLYKGRIAEIPLDALLERLKEQVSARRNVVMKFHRYDGSVGPVGGFHMQYTVERQAVSPLQALQYGQNAYRISVARWSILPGDTLDAETVDSALRIGSRFRQILEATDADTVVTIWLYPQDFQYFQQIRELAHSLNLRVAARPLPEGTPIAGSPSGSRSTSQ